MKKLPKLSRVFRMAALLVMTVSFQSTADAPSPEQPPLEQQTQLTPVLSGPFDRHSMIMREMVGWPQRQKDLLKDPTINKAYELWLSDLACVKDAPLLEQVKTVNDYVNRNVTYTSDSALYNAFEYFAPAAKTALFRRGDCEDFAIAKYDALYNLGVPRSRLALLVGATSDTLTQPNHCVLAVDTSAANDWTNCLILNNYAYTVGCTTTSLARLQDTGFNPMIALNDSLIGNVAVKTRLVPRR